MCDNLVRRTRALRFRCGKLREKLFTAPARRAPVGVCAPVPHSCRQKAGSVCLLLQSRNPAGTAVPITKLFARGGGEVEDMYYEEYVCVYYCRT
jgi:hypothetical protein